MADRSDRIAILRLVITGIFVIGGSTLASVSSTHLSFGLSETITYHESMLTALLIPLIVAPPAYCYVAMLSWRLHKANRLLDVMARKDVLTGLWNRRAFVEQAQHELASGEPHLLVMVDIDHFKRINDSMGHAAGDLALQHAANVLASMAPPGSLVARLGGEEFAMLIPAQGEHDAQTEALVEAVRARLEHMPFITATGLTRMTASFGLAPHRTGETLEQLLCRADKALYTAKDSGRNRLALAG